MSRLTMRIQRYKRHVKTTYSSRMPSLQELWWIHSSPSSMSISTLLPERQSNSTLELTPGTPLK